LELFNIGQSKSRQSPLYVSTLHVPATVMIYTATGAAVEL
jgi:hypothetical protein